MAKLAMPILDPLYGWNWKTAEPISDKHFVDFNYETDFLFLLDKDDPVTKSVLHIEFQTNKSRSLSRRMLTYFAVLHQKHQCPVLQLVIFLKKRKKTASHFRLYIPGQVDFSYRALFLHELSFQRLIELGIPEAFVVAILSDFGDLSPEEAMAQILSNIQAKSDNNSYWQHVQNLVVLSDLRNLSSILHQQLDTMPNIYKTLLRKGKTGENPIIHNLLEESRMEGIVEGEAKGRVEGEEKGRMEVMRNSIRAMLSTQKFSVEEIADLLNAPLELVWSVQRELSK